MLTALDFTKPTANQDEGFCFGVDTAKTAASLRQLADALETGRISPQSVRVVSFAKGDDFTMTTIRLVVAEKKLKSLHTNQLFPVAHAR